MPSSSWKRAVSSQPSRTCAAGSVRRWARSTGSRSSCGAHAGRVGLTRAASGRVGMAIGISVPVPVPARVSVTYWYASTSLALARTAASRPQRRISSMVLVLMSMARDSSDASGRFSTSRTSTP